MAKNNYQLGQARTGNERRGGPGGRMAVAEKPKDMGAAIRNILSYLNKFIPQVATALVCSVISVMLTLFGPDQLSRITNLIEEGLKEGHVDMSAVTRIALRVLAFYIFSALLIWIQSYTLASASRFAMRDMRNDICRKINRMPLSRFDSSSFGDLLSRVTNDVDSIGMSLNNGLVELVNAFVTFAGCTVMMFLANVKLTFIVLFCGLSGMFIMNFIINKSQPFFSRRSRYLGEINGHIEEMYAGHIVVKAYNGDEESKNEFERINKLLFANNWKSQFLSGIMFPMMEFLGNLGYVAVCVAGAMMVRSGEIRFGTIIAFVLYTRQFTMPLGQVAQAVTSLQTSLAGAERIFGFLSEEEMEDESGKEDLLQDIKGEVEFKNVRFGYDPGRDIIHDFSVKIKPGMKVAIVGPTGAGKTTLVNLLMRFYEINDGKILIDGIDTRQVTRANVHDQFCMVLQDTWLFEGTVTENIAYCLKGVTQEQVENACKAVGLHNYISTLPKGYDTMLSDESNLSAGQKQLMTIARAMVHDCPLLILDEATSSVDTRTEQIVQDAMERLTEGKTSFTIAHRLSTIRGADVILVMKDGDIVETGTHNELLAKGGFYSDLWTSQFVNAEAI
ncbi:MAG: ABC transporter ATP-binding protein [Oscillospiraceae bacterium]|nr:ABC transporter ATP-binding protein [Oscillospiraceae bacterium]